MRAWRDTPTTLRSARFWHEQLGGTTALAGQQARTKVPYYTDKSDVLGPKKLLGFNPVIVALGCTTGLAKLCEGESCSWAHPRGKFRSLLHARYCGRELTSEVSLGLFVEDLLPLLVSKSRLLA
jgi:hypothetical protein